jgi:predicted Zn-dependent peptidase
MSKTKCLKFSNGITLLAEEMPNVASVAFSLKLPCGEMYAEDKISGVSSILADWMFRGTQNNTNRELSDKLDFLGLHRNTGVSYSHITLGATLESGNLMSALELFAEIAQKPRFEERQFQFSKELAMQELTSLDDDPRQKVMANVKEHFFPYPYGRNPMGNKDSLKNLSSQNTIDFYNQNLDFSNSIFSIAGKFDLKEIEQKISGLFGLESKGSKKELTTKENGNRYFHTNYDGAQIHIGLMTKASCILDDNYYETLLSAEILGGGMSSRLFTEVREKRGLCYAIGSKYGSIKGMGAISCYAGTVPEKAQQTIDTIYDEFAKLSNGVSQDELNIAKVGLKSSLIMSGESTSARAGSIASDFYLLGRVRTFEEIKEKIEAVTLDGLNNFLSSSNFNDFTVCTIGPSQLTIK